MPKFNKKKLPSRHTSLGPDRAPHRSFYYAMGETEKDVSKPFVGVVSTWNEAAPCNIALMRQAQSVKKGVTSFPLYLPGRIDPPYINTLGTFNLTIDIIKPGKDLSHPAIPTNAS